MKANRKKLISKALNPDFRTKQEWLKFKGHFRILSERIQIKHLLTIYQIAKEPCVKSSRWLIVYALFCQGNLLLFLDQIGNRRKELTILEHNQRYVGKYNCILSEKDGFCNHTLQR